MQLPYILTVALLALGAVAAPSLEERTWNKNSCKDGQKWNDYKKSCECPPKQQYISHKCRYPPIPEPHCPWGQKSYCSNKNDWGLYRTPVAFPPPLASIYSYAWLVTLLTFH